MERLTATTSLRVMTILGWMAAVNVTAVVLPASNPFLELEA